MCAINGIMGQVDEALVKRMNAATAHRGPDGTAVWAGEGIVLGHNRLAIIDLSPEAAQPMHSASGRFVITYNGELYNYKELRAQLKAYPFKTQSDTEVILAAFEQWGTDCLKRFDGMFALAIWDTKEKELVLARDQSGIKPLFYSQQNDRLLFSSELKGILADAAIIRKINHLALESYLRLRYVPEPLTMITGVSKLPPASFCIIKNKTISITKYFEAKFEPVVRDSLATVAGRVEELIDESVKAQLVSDRPVGLFLSGGLDSTIVLDSATKAKGAVETFSLRFAVRDDEDPQKFNADADLAKLTAAHYGARHHEVLLDEAIFVRLLPETIRQLDQPIANATAVAQLFLAREAHRHIVVALQGDGGDELFGGYPRYRLSLLMDWYQYLPGMVRTMLGGVSSRLKKLNTPAGIERMKLFMFEKDETLLRAVNKEFVTLAPAGQFTRAYLTGKEGVDFTSVFMDADRQSWLADEALARTDTMTMASGLEARVPLLAVGLIAYASRLPSSARVSLFENKKILRRAFAGRLPKHVLDAKKRGFFSPMAKWLRRPAVLKLVQGALSPGFHSGTDTLLNFPGVQKMLDDHVAGRGYALSTLWTLVTFRLWAKSYDAML